MKLPWKTQRDDNMVIEVGDVILFKDVAVGYVYEQNDNSLLAYFPSWGTSIKVLPDDEAVTRISKHRKPSRGNSVFNTKYGTGLIASTSVMNDTFAVSYNILGLDRDKQKVYSNDGIACEMPDHGKPYNYRVFDVAPSQPFRPKDLRERVSDLEAEVARIKRYLVAN